MNIPFGKRHLSIQLDRGPAEFALESALVEATDREIERIARNNNRQPDLRLDVVATMYGWHL